jgi:hypothetical protein
LQRIIAASCLFDEGKQCRSGLVKNVTMICREGVSQRARSQILAEAMHTLRQDVAVHLCAHKNIVSLLSLMLPGCHQAASRRTAERRCKIGSGRRGSNPRQPAWKAGVRKITACLARVAFTGCLKSVSSSSRSHGKSYCMHLSPLSAKIFTCKRRQVPTRFRPHQEYIL